MTLSRRHLMYTLSAAGAAPAMAYAASALAQNPSVSQGPVDGKEEDKGGLPLGIVNVRVFGARGDGRHDDTAAIQAALDHALDLGHRLSRHPIFDGAGNDGAGGEEKKHREIALPVYFPPGKYLVGTLIWRAQSLMGAGAHSVLLGRPGRDILLADNGDFPRYAFAQGFVRDLTFVVDDSADVSSAAGRGGVGNAAIAFELADANVLDRRWAPGGFFSNLRFQSKSGGARNASCGMYLQRDLYGATLLHLHFFRLGFGYWDDVAKANWQEQEKAPDHNSYINISINGCDQGFRALNGARCVIQNMHIYKPRLGFALDGVNSRNRDQPYQWAVDGLFVEAASGDSLRLSGSYHHFNNCVIAPEKGGGISIGCDRSWISNSIFGGAGDDAVHLTGSGNAIESSTFRRPGLVRDLGVGNTVMARGYVSVATGAPMAETPGKMGFRVRDTASPLAGHVAPMFRSGLDLLIAPGDITPAGSESAHWRVVPSSVADGAELGHLGQTAQGGSLFFHQLNRVDMTVGEVLPAAHLRLYFKARTPDGPSRQRWKLLVAGVPVADRDLSWESDFSVRSLEADLSAARPGAGVTLAANTLASGARLDLAWIFIRPYARDLLVEDAVEFADGPRVMAGAGAPRAGTFRRGDRVLNTLPEAGGPAGWICLQPGRPGTWKPFGRIDD